MKKTVSILKKTLKVFLWVIISYVLLLVVIAVLIQIPFIQNKIVQKATTLVSNKTHSKVVIEKIRIAFPKSVVIKGLYLEDLKKDTLVYAGYVKVNIAFKELFQNKIQINSFALEDVSLNINRMAHDSLFNYNFLSTAFSDTSNQKIVAPKQNSAWTFGTDNVSLKNIRIQFNDNYGNMDVSADIKQFKLENAAIDLEKQLVLINLVALANSTIRYSTKDSIVSDTVNSTTAKNNWKVTVNHIDLENNSLAYNVEYKPEIKNGIDPSHLVLKQVTLKAANMFYSSDKTEVTIEEFAATDQSGLSITNFKTEFAMDKHSITAKNMLMQIGANTTLETDLSITGLPGFEAATFSFPNLKITSGKKDILMMAGSSVPESIELPEIISLQIAFNGQIKSFESMLDVNSSFGSAHINAKIDRAENFSSNLNFKEFDLGSLLKDTTMFGPVSLTAEMNGQGFDPATIRATIKAEVSQIYLNKYNYHKLNVDGNIEGRKFEGKFNLNDENAVFDFSGLVNLNPNQEQYKFNLNVEGINLQKLNFSKKDVRIGLNAVADLKGGKVNEISGRAGVSKIIVMAEGKKYTLDSLLFASINEQKKKELNFSSAIIGIKYSGTISPVNLSAELNRFLNKYFPFSEPVTQINNAEPQNFNFAIQLHNHPIISEVFFPQLKEFEPGIIQGSFDSQKDELKLNATLNKLVYGSTEINNLAIDIQSDSNALNYKISSSNISNSQIKFENLSVDGKLADMTLDVNISSIDNKQNKKLVVRSQIVKDGANFKLTLDPKEFYLMNDRWNIAADNYIKFGKPGFLIHHFFINKSENQINIASLHDQFNDDLNIEIKNFKLSDVSRIIEKDTSIVKGNVDGNVLLKRVNNTYGIIADAKITNLVVREVPIGNLSIKAVNPTSEKFDINVNMSGSDNNLTAEGYFIPNGGDNSINIKTTIQSLSLKTLKALSFGQITEASGNLTGNVTIEGNTTMPDITGELVLNNAFITPAMLNNRLEFKNEKVLLKKDGIYFNSFTILDVKQNSAILDGAVKMEHFKNYIFDLHVNTKDFLLINTTANDNKEFFGRMIVDSKIDINGPFTLPVVNAKLKMKKGSNFTFSVPEEKLTTDKGENVIEFNDPLSYNTILYGNIKKQKLNTGSTEFDISSIIEIDKQATLKLLIDPSSSDSLVVKGEAALSFGLDRSGKMSLTGAYNLKEGSYLVSFESIIKRKFSIEPGSTIIWNGEPLDAEASINAIYSVRASPIELISDQLTGMSETDKNSYKQRYPFLVVLKLRGEISQPEISFEIQLPPDYKGILGGAVNAKLNMLNEDESALNKQVFALLVLGRFIQENPLQTETSGISTTARTTVGKFLSAQLNQLSSKLVPGVELNFDVQSYNDFQSGQAQGRTQVEIGMKKQLFNERLSVQLGGTVDVEGEKAKQNSASDITSDVTLEYKITEDGRLRLKGFRHNQYEGAIEGQLVETGAGVLFVRDFDKWNNFFGTNKKSVSAKKANSNDTINHK